MIDPTRRRQDALLQFASAACFMLLALPLALLYDVHRASTSAGLNGDSLRVGALEFAWPVYAVVAIGAFWVVLGWNAWSDAHAEERRPVVQTKAEDSVD